MFRSCFRSSCLNQDVLFEMDLEQQFENEPLNMDVPKISDSEQYHEKPKETPISQNANGKRKIDEENTYKKKRNGRFTEGTIPEELTHIGNNVFVGPTSFQRKDQVHTSGNTANVTRTADPRTRRDLKYPKLIDCEELAIYKTETINSMALKLNSIDIARQFYGNVWTEEPYFTSD
ncbi:uncharacterized protein LOC118181185 [Stegodyphus dumicola]|uniref:uncharacterized protein LOC118181185 n=1 Tax=Stegodyphus dumicola TaxID=202533 RepID=UPI0015AA7A5B|nr:uncharacterized protein LOC118181185 [Stegodyphus dumicola]